MVFDLGVMMLVMGATVLTLIALAHQSIRKPRIIKPERDDDDVELDAAPAPVSEQPAEATT